MNDLELLKSELAINGISVMSDGTCQASTPDSDIPVSMNCEDKILQLSQEINQSKQEFKKMWKSFTDTLVRCDGSRIGGSGSTEKMYVNALKQAYRFSKKFRYFEPHRLLLRKRLNQDIKKCPESAMTKAVDYHICLDWLLRDIKNDSYKILLLKKWIKEIHNVRNVTSQQMTPSALDLPMKERVWKWEEDQEDWDQRQKDIRNQQRYQLPETYNDPNSFEEGFFWREIRNDPYSFWDEENSPYPHYYNYKSKVHRGME